MVDVVLMCGLPGSGKSTYALKHFPNYIYLNQDALGSRGLCEKLLSEALESGKSAVVDRCNLTIKQRQSFINIALQHGVDDLRAIHLVVPEEEAIARIVNRKGHPTITPSLSLDKKKMIVYEFAKSTQIPTLDEGFKSILTMRSY